MKYTIYRAKQQDGHYYCTGSIDLTKKAVKVLLGRQKNGAFTWQLNRNPIVSIEEIEITKTEKVLNNYTIDNFI